jgi:hypothetical protein
MKKYFLVTGFVASLGFLPACHNNNAANLADIEKNGKIANAYLDSMNQADSLAKYGTPLTVDFTQVLDKANDGKRVSIEGYVTMPTTSYQSGSSAQLDFIERPNEFSAPFNFILSVNVGDGKNTMKTLPDKYKAEDIVITGKNGEKIGVGDRVKITGKLSANSDYCSLDCQEIEKVDPVEIDYSKLNATKITSSSPATAAQNDKLVYAEGTLEIPSLTTGGDYTFVYLNVPGMTDHLTIDIAYGDGPAKLEPLPDNYTEKDFKVHDNKGDVINTKKKVRVYGLWKDDRFKVESIENI